MANRTILLIEADVDSALVVQRALSGLGHVSWAKTLAHGLDQLQGCVGGVDPQICAVVCNLQLPDSQGIATFERLFAQCPRVPVIVIVDREHQAAATLALRRGAQSYVLSDRFEDHVLVDVVERSIERADDAEALFEEKERAQVTLDAIADGVITTDERGLVTYCNPVAARLTGWSSEQALGLPFLDVFRLVDIANRRLSDDPMGRAIRENAVACLPLDCLLVRRDGNRTTIADSVAPIHDRGGKVVGAVMVFRDTSAARAAAMKMSYLAQHDPLTDLPNRLLLADRLRQAVEIAKRQRQMLAVLFLDLDRFKNINDSLGHSVGDGLLQSVAQRLVGCVRSADTVSRQGGDEFVILLPDVKHVEDAAITAEKVLQATSLPHQVDEHELHVTASVGIVVYPEDGQDDATLLQNADAAMYHAKESGRNNYQFFTADMKVRAVERQQIESEMRQALKHGQFVLRYQPIVDLEDRTIVGVEALVRWQHPRRGLLHPQSFLTVAEQCGIVVPMGRWVVREACRQARVWRDAGSLSLRIGVNISALELRAKGFVASVRDSLEETGLEAEDLELEITETFLLQESSTTVDLLGAIADMGVQLALDDFGTGYSSLSHLRRFPIDTLKIDRSFINELATDSSDASIVGAVISLGRGLHLRVVAEGVETAAQVALLQSQGCPEVQGYYFGAPVESHSLAGMLGRQAVAAAP